MKKPSIFKAVLVFLVTATILLDLARQFGLPDVSGMGGVVCAVAYYALRRRRYRRWLRGDDLDHDSPGAPTIAAP